MIIGKNGWRKGRLDEGIFREWWTGRYGRD